MGKFTFFALAFRMKYINRWGLMRNLRYENLTEHAAECAMLSHALCEIGNEYFGKNYDSKKIALCALYHDMSEIYTGDMPTPVKYFNDTMRDSYKAIESQAIGKILSKLPEKLSPKYKEVLDFEDDKEIKNIVKAADKLCAYLKCREECHNGNKEFEKALISTKALLDKAGENCPELVWFLENCADSFNEPVDEL